MAPSNADLLVGASETERNRPEWLRTYQAPGGDYSDQVVVRPLLWLPRV